MATRLGPFRLTLGATLLFLLHQGWSPYWPNRWVDSYLDDVLFLPVVLGWGAMGFRGLLKTPRPIPLGWWLSASIYLVLMVEVGFPRWNPAFVYDPWDFLAYAFGAGLYALSQPAASEAKAAHSAADYRGERATEMPLREKAH